ncbi:MAG: hypothetical protein Q7U64_13870 [Desulfocapsaceae bacterium]|nr:hypothetical protein [Desulfocapsaceae bacterium]
MRCIIGTTIMFILLASTAWADAFQFISKSNGALAVEAAVYFNGQLIGYSNGQGIIFINSPQGLNTFEVSYMGQRSQIQLKISGDPQVKTIYLK